VAKPFGKPPLREGRRNIGVLHKHLPRCGQVLEADTTARVPPRLAHKLSENVSKVLDVIPAILGCCVRSCPNMAIAAELRRRTIRGCPAMRRRARAQIGFEVIGYPRPQRRFL
jgi:hypothetical protein